MKDNFKKKNALSEISESLKFNVYETSEVDGKNILARVVGPAFFPDSISDNNVEYTLDFWNNILTDEEVIKRLEDRVMFGTIGHEIVHIDNEQLLKGVASHITTKMWIEEVDDRLVGMAEHLVLNTEAGRTLNTILRAGSKLRVSTRGLGDTTVRKSDGVNVITDYYFQRIDFVILPGFDDALPSVVESLNSEAGSISNVEENPDMDKDQEKSLQILEERVEELKAELESAKAETKTVQESLDETKEENSELKAKLAAYDDLGTPSEINEALDVTETKLNELTAENERLSAEAVKDVSTTADLEAKVDVLEEELEEYKELGTPSEISEALDILESSTNKTRKLVAESLARKYRTSKSIVEALVETKGAEETEQLLAESSEKQVETEEAFNPDIATTEDTTAKVEKDEETKTVAEGRRFPANLAGRRSPAKSRTLGEALGTSDSLAAKLLRQTRKI